MDPSYTLVKITGLWAAQNGFEDSKDLLDDFFFKK